MAVQGLPDFEALGKVAYEGYATYTGFKSLATGDDLPRWQDLPQAIQSAWVASVTAVHYELERAKG